MGRREAEALASYEMHENFLYISRFTLICPSRSAPIIDCSPDPDTEQKGKEKPRITNPMSSLLSCNREIKRKYSSKRP